MAELDAMDNVEIISLKRDIAKLKENVDFYERYVFFLRDSISFQKEELEFWKKAYFNSKGRLK
jgi:hypothetical protein